MKKSKNKSKKKKNVSRTFELYSTRQRNPFSISSPLPHDSSNVPDYYYCIPRPLTTHPPLQRIRTHPEEAPSYSPAARKFVYLTRSTIEVAHFRYNVFSR